MGNRTGPIEGSAEKRTAKRTRAASFDAPLTNRASLFRGGIFECSSRMNGNPSSPVLRGLGASDGARPLDESFFDSAHDEIRVVSGKMRLANTLRRYRNTES